MPKKPFRGRRAPSACLQILAIAAAAFLLIQTVAFIFPAFIPTASANSTPQAPPFTQNWNNTGLITANDNWSGVPGIEGYLGQDITTSTGADPQTLLGTSTVASDLDVIANQTNPNTLNSGGVAEFEATLQSAPANANPTIALNGSGTADAPYILLYLNTTGQTGINVAYNLRDLDCTVDNSIQRVALQYRVGSSGNFTNLPAGFVADATAQGNNTATDVANCTLVTLVSVQLPAAADNQSLVQVRIITTNAVGNDEWVGVDDINVTGTAASGLPTLSISDVTQNEGNAGTTTFSFTVSLSATAGAGGVTFDIATADGSAQDDNPAASEDSDYVAKSLTGQTIAQGNQQYTFEVTVNGDTVAEPNQNFFVNVTNVNGATVGDAQGQGTIVNDDLGLINQVQGNGANSPFAGSTAIVRGIVTLHKSNGFFLQEEVSDNDADPNTSEGIFVFTSVAPTVGVGDQVTVTGNVLEFNSLTEISTTNANVLVNNTGNSLPTAVTLTTADLPPTAPFSQPQLEKYEGMRLFASSLTTVAPTDEFFDVHTVITGRPRPLREPGIEASEPIPPDPTTGTPDCCIPIFDLNPERLVVDTNGRAGSTGEGLTSNVVITNVTGPLDYAFGAYRLVSQAPLSRSADMSAVPVPAPTSNEFTVGGFNIENFNNNATQRAKAALAIRDVMRLPHIIGHAEIFELSGLQALAAEVNSIAPGANYQAYLVEADGAGGDADQDVAFLVDASRVQVNSVTQIELAGCDGTAAKCNTFIDPNTGQPAYLNDRPPLVLNANIDPSGANVPVIVVVNHLRSFIDIELVTGEGPRVRAKRKAQAEFLANLLQELQTNNPSTSVISVGDYNAFQFSDGYTDPIATIKGMPTPDEQIVVDASPDLVNPNYVNLIDNLPADQKYTFIFEGTPQVLDHVIVNTVAQSRNTRIAVARNNADFPELPAATFSGNASRPERNSDHDMPVAYFALSGPVPQSGSVLISEFRFFGPEGAGDEFIELYNNTDSPVNLKGWTIEAPDGSGGTVTIPLNGVLGARAHYLAAPIDYSLVLYPAGLSGSTATPDATFSVGSFLDNGGARLKESNGIVIDAVGFASASSAGYREGAGLLPAEGVVPSSADQYSFVRKMGSGFPQDTGDNAADFLLISTTGMVGSTVAQLGGPGPENTQSPIQSNSILKASVIDNCFDIGTPTSGCQNRVRDGSAGASNPNSALRGTLTFRRKFTNTSTENVVRLRFRVVDITTLNSPGYSPNNGQADLRLLSSSDTTVTPSNPFTPGDIQVRGSVLEQPPDQNVLGGGLNSTVTVELGDPIPPDGEVTVQFTLGVQQNGSYRFFVNTEAIFADPPVLLKTGRGKANRRR